MEIFSSCGKNSSGTDPILAIPFHHVAHLVLTRLIIQIYQLYLRSFCLWDTCFCDSRLLLCENNFHLVGQFGLVPDLTLADPFWCHLFAAMLSGNQLDLLSPQWFCYWGTCYRETFLPSPSENCGVKQSLQGQTVIADTIWCRSLDSDAEPMSKFSLVS